MPKAFTRHECAERLGCSPDQVSAFIESGELLAFNIGLGKQRARYRVCETELAAFQRRRSTSKPQLQTRKPVPSAMREWV